jgi:hypothetical protein
MGKRSRDRQKRQTKRADGNELEDSRDFSQGNARCIKGHRLPPAVVIRRDWGDDRSRGFCTRRDEVNNYGMPYKARKGATQVWAVGEMVKVGFLALRVTGKTPLGWKLTNKDGSKSYVFEPHHGLTPA